jgi:hypothetical protein
MSYANLAANIQGAVSQLSGALGLSTSDISPTYATSADGATVPRSFQREHWIKVESKSLYAFGVESVSAGNTLSIDRFVNQIVGSVFSNNEFTDFDLPITPQEISQTEEFAVSIRPTQGGTVVNHSGNKYKKLTISGTTGVHPFKRNDGASKLSGVTLNRNDELKYRSGYEVFQHFRAWIKGYHESKKFPLKENLRMIFRNFKDWEFLYVEPLSFTMKRDAAKPLLYNYSIDFKVLSHVPNPQPFLPFFIEVTGGVVAKAQSYLFNAYKNLTVSNLITSTVGSPKQITDSVRRVHQALRRVLGNPDDMSIISSRNIQENVTRRDAQQILESIASVLRQIGDDPKTFTKVSGGDSASLPNDPKDLADSLEDAADPSNTNSDPKSVLLTILEALSPDILKQISTDVLPDAAKNALQKEQNESATIARSELEALRKELTALSDKFADAIGLGSDQYNSTFNFTATSDVTETGDITDKGQDVLYGAAQGIAGLDLLLSNDEFFDALEASNSKATAENGAQTIGDGVFKFPSPTSGVREGIVPFGATLERIAESELGSADRWTELAELNSLKAPYIEDDTTSGFKINFTIQSAGFNNPNDLRSPLIGNYYIINNDPAPLNAWTGKGDQIAEFLGGDFTVQSNWRFLIPEEGSVAFLVDHDEYLQYIDSEWIDFDPDTDLQADGVLRPGDVILLPTNQSPTLETQILGPRDNIWTNSLTQAERSLSVDLKLTESGDLDLLPSGDFNVSTGKTNGAQAIVLKLLYSKGTYPNFSEIGSSLGVGGKIPSVAKMRTEILNSLLQDPRIKDVSQINLLQQGNTINLSFTVFFKDIQDPVPISIPVG